MEPRIEALVLGIGNVLWADEGFGVRCVEALHAAFAFPAGVVLMDGGTLGLNLYEPVATAERVLSVRRDRLHAGVPGRCECCAATKCPPGARTKLSPHQTGFNDVLALAGPQRLRAGVDRRDRGATGGAQRLRREPAEGVRARIPEAVALAERELAGWGFPGRPRKPGESFAALNATPLEMAHTRPGGRPKPTPAAQAIRAFSERR